MVRQTVAALSLFAVLASGSAAASARAAAPAAAPAPAITFAISGRGWGHGVGMSQWGAYGFAQRGYGYARILAHYYPTTVLGRAPVARVRVLLADGKRALTVSSDQAFRVRDGADGAYELAEGSYPLGPGLKVNVDGTKPEALAGPLLFTAGLAPVELNGKSYRGSLEVSVEKGRLRAINAVSLESYLYGVVPDEVPHTWVPEALKAQAVVARSYALAVRKTGAFDLYDDTRSQVYGGIASEEPTTTAAVNATAGQVVLHEGKVATTFFFSTSGGRTANVADVWDGASPTPYLVSVPDPYDSLSPHHDWGPFSFAAGRLARTLGVKGGLFDVRTTMNRSGRVDQVIGVGAGGETSVPSATIRRALGLRSTWFSVGVLALNRIPKPLVYGSRVPLAGLARGLPAVTLEQRAGSTLWETAGAVMAAKDGSFAHAVSPGVSTEYRLASGTVRSAPVRVAVAPLVRLATPTQSTSLRGLARPLLAGATVVIQRRQGTVWKGVAGAKVDEKGAFEAQLELTPGSYRARLAPGRGFAPGFSAILNVVPAQ
ncbi:MAG: SpoIID/LytB domain-containing protein [Gaiellaceae bacterium]